MNVLLLTFGTRGDVQPFVALGKRLQSAGHDVTLCTSVSFRPFVTGNGLRYGEMNDDIIELLRSDAGKRIVDTSAGLWQWVKAARTMSKLAAPMHRRMLEETWATTRAASPDLLVFHPKAFGAPHFADLLNVPAVMASPLPVLVPTRDFPALGFPHLPLGGWYNRATYGLFHKLMSVSFGKALRQWRAEHGLPPAQTGHPLRTPGGRRIPVLHAYSRHVIPHPPDWPDDAFTTGYWFLDGDEVWTPPDPLRDFLAAGEAPVYIGFGSMISADPVRLTRMILDGVRRAGVRAVLATGWGGLVGVELPDSIHVVDEAPHHWLFPRVSAIVHHGGAGTTAAALRAGRPNLICPFLGDQPLWGRRVHALGAGPSPIPRKRLNADNFSAAILEMLAKPDMRLKAEEVGRKIRSEDGVAAALRTLHSRILDGRVGVT